MKLNIFSKLFLAVLLATLILTLFMVFFMNWSFRTGFAAYYHEREVKRVEVLAELIGEEYATAGSWDALFAHPRAWGRLLRQIGERPPPRHHRPAPRTANRLATRLSLLNRDGEVLINHHLPRPYTHQLPINVDGRIIGHLGLRQIDLRHNQWAHSFLSQQLRNLYLIALVAALVSLLTAMILVRHFLRPVKSLTQGAEALTAGQFTSRIATNTHDELGQLAARFNTLADTLQKNEQTRRQWITDISHELRTPIAVLRSEIEAIQDGVRKPDETRIASLHQEVVALGRLVDDLHQLSLSDAGDWVLERVPLNLTTLLADTSLALQAHCQRNALDLHMTAAEHPVQVMGDATRLRQLFTNLLENSCRYTDAGGTVALALTTDAKHALITVQDSKPGVPDEALPQLFERLYRVDASRNRLSGGSGLGLSIAKNIVEGHDGTIEAAHSPLGGLLVRITLPLAENH